MADLAVLTAGVYWLTARLTGGRLYALATAAAFFAVETHSPYRLVVNHRWDSTALLLAALAAACRAPQSPAGAAGAGLCAGAAVATTPSTLPVALVVAAWLGWRAPSRRPTSARSRSVLPRSPRRSPSKVRSARSWTNFSGMPAITCRPTASPTAAWRWPTATRSPAPRAHSTCSARRS